MNFQARKSKLFNEYQITFGIGYNEALRRLGINSYKNIDSFDLSKMQSQIAAEKELKNLIKVNNFEQDRELTALKDFFKKSIKGTDITLSQLPLMRAIDEIIITPDTPLLVNIGKTYVKIANAEDLKEFGDKAENFGLETVEQYGSDKITEIVRAYDIGTKYTFKIPILGKRRPNGGFFKYYHNMPKVDLSCYGIFRNAAEAEYDTNCLLLAIELWQRNGVNLISTVDLDKVKLKIRTRFVPQKDLRTIAEDLNIEIVLTKLDSNGVNKQFVYNRNNKLNRLKLGLFDEHYFLIEKTNYTHDSIKFYDSICDKIDFNKQVFNGKVFKTHNDRFVTSFIIIKELLSAPGKYLTPIDLTNCGTFSFHKKIQDYTVLPEVTNKDVELCKYYPIGPPAAFKTKVGNKTVMLYYEIEYFDTETYIKDSLHTPYMICSETRDGAKSCFTGDNCILKWLKNITTNKILIAHNLRYDFQFVIRYLNNVSGMIKTGQRIKTVSGEFYNKDTGKTHILVFKDSAGLIEAKLSSFTKMFKLAGVKEIMPYHIYTADSVKQKSYSVADACKTFDEITKKEFEANLENLKLFVDDTKEQFYHMVYAKFYCEQDVNILKQGYEIFRGWMKTATNDLIDIDNVVSLPQLAYTFGLSEGVFDGCYKLKGVARDFIQRCVVGGRCMTRANQKFEINHHVDDFDGVSLYPSAMARIPGFLKGKPKVITDDMIRSGSYNTKCGYFVCIDVKDVKIKRNFPLISKKDPETFVRNFSNDIRGIIYVDKFMLEDLIKHHDIDFEVLRGYYFNEGRNNKINDFIANLFNLRLKKKQEKNPIETVYKLIMNAFYGKTITKPIEDEFIFKTGIDNCEKHLSYRFNHISEFTKLTDSMWMFKEKRSINDHSSLPHIGAEILSVSKRIMNEVMCLAEDNKIEIYYQDTDSMHIDRRPIYTERNLTGPEYLSELFSQTYGRKLIGSGLGQFHSDFNFPSADKLPVSVRSIYCGKKSYYDNVEYYPSADETKYGDHCRLKGIPNELIYQKTKELGYSSVCSLYEKMLSGDAVEFDFKHITKFNFKTNADFTTTIYDKFTRKVKF